MLEAKIKERNRWLAEALERGDGRAWVARASPPTVTLPRCQPLCTLQLFTLRTPRIYPTDVVCTFPFTVDVDVDQIKKNQEIIAD